ncbi:MAG: hypothetical protein R2713_00985 [Ilumatobacteraceae bacterium]
MYGRIGTTTTEFGTDHVVARGRGEPGGRQPRRGRCRCSPRRSPRVRRSRQVGARVPDRPWFDAGATALPEVMGEYPAAALAEEITTPGDGGADASSPWPATRCSVRRTQRAASTRRSTSLEFMVSASTSTSTRPRVTPT